MQFKIKLTLSFFISITCDGQSNLNRIDDTSKNEHTSAHYIKFEIY